MGSCILNTALFSNKTRFKDSFTTPIQVLGRKISKIRIHWNVVFLRVGEIFVMSSLT